MQQVLGADWQKLPPGLRAHYAAGFTTDTGELDIEFPRFMGPFLRVLRYLGALLHRRGHQVSAIVDKQVAAESLRFHRTIVYPDRETLHFDSVWVSAGDHQLIEFVNPVLGLQMRVHVVDARLHFEGLRFVVRLGRWLLPIPEWLVLGHTTIVEEAIDDSSFAMDFRMTHPLLGQLFRYSGRFRSRTR